MLFDWDPAKSERNRLARGIGFAFATLIFEGVTIEWPDDRKNDGEARIRAIGEVGGRILHLVYTDRGNTRHIISARMANRKERERWCTNQ